jgi:hypothetical protein
MNPTDQRMDRLLHALSTEPVPEGLEQRISARVAQRTAELDESRPSKLGAILQANPLGPYAIAPAALTVMAAVCLLVFAHSGVRQTTRLNLPTTLPGRATAPPAELVPASSVSHSTLAMSVSRASSLLDSPSSQQDPDAIALNETLAPSHPAPALPLTAQEALLLRSTRRGQPMEVAELDTLLEAALMNRVTEQRRASLRETIQGLLGPLATAQALTSDSTQPDDSKTTADADSPTR